jgi:hypothetical protein
MVKRRTKRARMVSGNLLLAFFNDKIRLHVIVSSKKHFSYVRKESFAIFLIVTFVFFISWQGERSHYSDSLLVF